MESISLEAPLRLDPARAWRTYLGGSRIDALHGRAGQADGHFPEEWILSVVTARNTGREDYPNEGLSFVSGTDISLRDVIASDPRSALGRAHADAFGATTGVLLKLLDAAERLTIQVHPDKSTAKRLFHSGFGKTECWYVLGGREIDGEKPCVYLGFREGVTREHWRDLFIRQDIPAMLNCLHRFETEPGQTILIEGGVPHAIGAGCLLFEIQEPTDYSIRTERTTPKGMPVPDFLCHQGLGFEAMFDCFHYEPLSERETQKRWLYAPKPVVRTKGADSVRLIGYDKTPCFSLYRHEIEKSAAFAPQDFFFGLYVLSGSGELECGGRKNPLRPGAQFFVPAASRSFTVRAERPVTLFECRGPNPGSAS